MRIRRPLVMALCGALICCLSPTHPQLLNGVPPQRLALLARGINLNNWFSPWASPAAYAEAFHPEEAAFLKRAGFTVCRVPLDPDLLFDPSDPATPKPTINAVDRGVRLLLDAGLAVIFDPIHGSSASVEWETGLDHDPAFLGKAQTYWEALAKHFAGFSTDRIFFEVMNELHLSARERVDPGWWQPVQESLVSAVRRGAPLNLRYDGREPPYYLRTTELTLMLWVGSVRSVRAEFAQEQRTSLPAVVYAPAVYTVPPLTRIEYAAELCDPSTASAVFVVLTQKHACPSD